MPVLEQPTDVLRQFSHGDLDAFEALFRRHQSEVYGWIVRIVRDPAAAEDLTVETFWRIYRARARFDPTRSFGAVGATHRQQRLARSSENGAAGNCPPRRSGVAAVARPRHLRG